MVADLSLHRTLGCLLLLGVVLATPASAVQFQARADLQTGIGFTTVLTLGPEDPAPTDVGDGCIYAANGGQGAVHRKVDERLRRTALRMRGISPDPEIF